MDPRSYYTKALLSLSFLLRGTNFNTYVQPIIGVRFAQLMPELYKKNNHPTFSAYAERRRNKDPALCHYCELHNSYRRDHTGSYCELCRILDNNDIPCNCEEGRELDIWVDNSPITGDRYINKTCSRKIYDIIQNDKSSCDDHNNCLIKKLEQGSYEEATSILKHVRYSEIWWIYDRPWVILDKRLNKVTDDTLYNHLLTMVYNGEACAPEFYHYLHMRSPKIYTLEKGELITSITAFVSLCFIAKEEREITEEFVYIFRRAIGHLSVNYDSTEEQIKKLYHRIFERMFSYPEMISRVILIATKEAGFLVPLMRKVLGHKPGEDEIYELYRDCHMKCVRIEDYWVYVVSEYYDLPHKDHILERIDMLMPSCLGEKRVRLKRGKSPHPRALKSAQKYRSPCCCVCS